MAEESDLEKTEQPSPRRLEKAREEGQVARSREWVTFALLASGAAGLWATSGLLGSHVGAAFYRGLTFDRAAAFDPAVMLAGAQAMSLDALAGIAPVFAVLAVVALVAPMLLGGLVLAPQSLAPDFSKLDPMSGMARMFSAQSAADLVKTLLKSLLIGTVGFVVVRDRVQAIGDLLGEPVRAAIPHTIALLAGSCAWIVAALALIALIDVPWQVWSLHRRLRMSREDLRQEHKESEGDPHIKARIKRQQQALARRRMMAEVPKAAVVVTNPTHFAVALRYEDSMSAPRVVAKGSDLVAQRIRELALAHRVEVLESAALARSLYRHTALGHEIPAGLYTAVAEVLAWVYQLRRWRSDGGAQPARPGNAPIPPALQYDGGAA
jgi:flagellar biosynthesis protein FlhB